MKFKREEVSWAISRVVENENNYCHKRGQRLPIEHDFRVMKEEVEIFKQNL